MTEYCEDIFQQEWVIWNTSNGLLTTVTIGEVARTNGARTAWLDEPFDMVGPFSLDELETEGRIAFAECLVMSRQRWQSDQAELRLESYKIRRNAEERIQEKLNKASANKRFEHKSKVFNELQHREILRLPVEGKIEPRQVNAAFRRLAQKAHPDAGGSNEQFVLISEARTALLENIS